MPASTNRSGLMGGLVALARAVGVRFPRAVCATRRRAQVRAAMYISLGDRLSVAALFHPLTEAVRCDARRRPLRRRRAEETHPADGRPPYFNQL